MAFFLTITLFFALQVLNAQNPKKQVVATRITEDIKIDGILDEASWKTAGVAKDFFQYTPYNARKPSQPTVVRVMYDNRSIYIGAMMYDSSPDSILTELGIRDAEDLNADEFTADISTYNDGLNASEFHVSASNVQGDAKLSPNDHDRSWDAVWNSAVTITDSGWIAEIEIPYSALRFPEKENQTWGVNFWRGIRRHREWDTWNYVNNKLDGVLNQAGEIMGLTQLDPPLRLSFVPYVAGYAERQPGKENWSYSYNYGMDVKLGLSESFTFDATLIPDFGQVESDDVIIDLSPFEIYYEEKRPFFTEGTELFDKGGVFYSRRIGGTPSGYEEINDDTTVTVISNPENMQLINASKLSGRTGKGLGIGVFNAITSNTWAEVRDSLGNKQKILTEPATNYNMLVLDQSLKNNSFVSLYNTNVYRGKKDYTANVSGMDIHLENKQNMFAVSAMGNVSQKYFRDTTPEFGYEYNIEIGKISGNFRYELWQETISDTYDPNDMGYTRRNNELTTGIQMEYNFFDPFWKFMDWSNEVAAYLSYLYNPRLYSEFGIEAFSRATWKNYLTTGFGIDIKPIEEHDHFESRTPGRMVVLPANYEVILFLSPDYRKKFVVDIRGGIEKANDYDQLSYSYSIGPRIRFSDRMFMVYRFNYNRELNNLGYVTDSTGQTGHKDIIFGARDILEIENELDASYIFNPKTSISLQARHYWFSADYNRYFDLQDDGHLLDNHYTGNHDFSFNAFNIDLVFIWEFAPGSQLLVIYKNNIFTDNDDIPKSFTDDVRETFSNPMTNSFSVKFLYYLDYQYFRKKSKR